MKCVNCNGHGHRFGPMQDCALLDCTCSGWVAPGDECADCGGSGYATTYDGRSLGVCTTCNGDGLGGAA